MRWQKHTVIQVVELEYKDGTLTSKRARPTHIE